MAITFRRETGDKIETPNRDALHDDCFTFHAMFWTFIANQMLKTRYIRKPASPADSSAPSESHSRHQNDDNESRKTFVSERRESREQES